MHVYLIYIFIVIVLAFALDLAGAPVVGRV